MDRPAAGWDALQHAARFPADDDADETREWLDALATLVDASGPARARFVLDALQDEALRHGLAWKPRRTTPYVNTIAVEAQPPFPGDLQVEQRLAALMRWNALAMVVRANQRYGELGGHIPATPARPTCSRSASTTSSARATPGRGATSSTSSRIRRRASTRAPSSRAGSTSATSSITGRRSPPRRPARAACAATRTPG